MDRAGKCVARRLFADQGEPQQETQALQTPLQDVEKPGKNQKPEKPQGSNARFKIDLQGSSQSE